MNWQNDRQAWLWTLAFVAVLILSLAKTLRLPIGYPASLMVLNYDQGFIRRGLFGAVVFGGEGPLAFAWIAGVAMGLLAVLMLLLIWVAVPILRAHPPLRLLCLLFASSLYVVYAASTAGYFDHLLLAIAALAVVLRGLLARAALLLAGGAVAILIHEAAILVTVPVLLMAVWLALDRTGRPALVPVALAGLALTALAFAVVRLGGLPPDAVAALESGLQARADFPLTDLAFEILASDPLDHARSFTARVNAIAHADSLIIAAPALGPILGVALILARRMDPGPVLVLLVVLAGLAPCLLRFAGSDIHRWDALAIGTAFLALALLLREADGAAALPPDWPALQPIIGVALVASAASTSFLFMGQQVDPWPFLGQRAILLDWIAGR